MDNYIKYIYIFIMMTYASLCDTVKGIREYLSQFTEPGIISKEPLISVSYFHLNSMLLYWYRIKRCIDVYIHKDRILIVVKDWLLYMDKQNKLKIVTKKALNKKWDNLINRCFRETSSSSKNYYERGISVCDEWRHDAKKFIVWAIMFGGYFEGSVIDRINNDKGYEPDNVRFVTYLESLNNKRGTLRLNVDGDDLPLTEWSRRTGIHYETLRALYHSDPEALEDMLRDAMNGMFDDDLDD